MDTPSCQHRQTSGADAVARRRDQHRAVLVVVLTLCGSGLGLLSLLPRSPAFIWNTTGSVPVGLYQIEARPAHKGDVIAISPDDAMRNLAGNHILPAGRLLLKKLAATRGDIVCRTGAHITINGDTAAIARAATRDGTLLPVWNGCLGLGAGQILALAPHASSFDGRYLGAIDASLVIGVARPVFTLPQTEAP